MNLNQPMIDVIVDLQFGSTGKGLFAGYLAKRHNYDTIITAWGPNAGHTFIDSSGRKFVNIALPNGIVSSGLKRIMIGPGSVIDRDRLVAELNSYRDLIADRGVEVIIHRAAVVRQERHLMTEKAYAFKIGSTMKGVGAAVIDKIKRDPDSPVLIGDVGADGMALRAIPEVRIVDSYEWIKILYKHCQQILIEGSQGYSLSINHGFYPYVTSRDCTVQQLAVDCGVPWAMMRLATIHGVARTYPIRVANRFDENGTQIGTSGPCYPDQQEITWGSISQEPELTTVTKLPRRLFTFSEIQFLDALLMNGVGHVFLNFVNYLRPEGVKLDWFVNSARLAGAEIRWVGHGPNETDIREI